MAIDMTKIEAFASELAFWKSMFRIWWETGFEKVRQMQTMSLQNELARRLPDGCTSARILDVGAGPFTTLGKHLDGVSLHIEAVDPLAVEYNELINQYGIQTTVRTKPGDGHELTGLYAKESFDIVYSRNALDHCDDPIQVLRQMVQLIKPNGAVYIITRRCAGENNNYSGLHRWNFDGCRFCRTISIFNRTEYHRLEFVIPNYMYYFFEEYVNNDGDWLHIVIERKK